MVIDTKDYDSKLEDQGWKKMEALLDKEKPKAVFPIYKLLPYAATLLIGAFGGIMLWKTSPELISPQVSADQYKIFPLKGYDFTPDQPDFTEIAINPFSTPVQENSATVLEKQLVENKSDLTLVDGQMNNNFSEQPSKSLIAGNSNNSFTPRVIDFAIGVTSENETEEKAIIRSIDELSKEFKSELDNNEIPENLIAQDVDLGDLTPDKQPTQGVFLPTGIGQSALVKNEQSVKTSGSVGLVSSGFNEYGVRLGLEFKKPLTSNLSVASGVRYSKYKDQYKDTYDVSSVPSVVTERPLINDLAGRAVNRNFVEVPLYLDYKVNDIAKLKAGVSVTYNNNNSSNPTISASSIANNVALDAATKYYAPGFYNDQHGYLGEAVLGATINVDKIALDAEVLKGLISNQDIDNRSVVGLRLSYTFGNK